MSDGRVGFVAEPNGRGTTSLLWSCLFTWLLCLWNMFHINIPARNEKWIWYVGHKLSWVVFIAFVPEWMSAMAMTQWRDASMFLCEARSMHTRAYLPQPCLADEEPGSCWMETTAIQNLRATNLDHWTLRHGFYCAMGGFVISVPDDRLRPFPVNPKQLLWLMAKGLIRIPSVTSKEIEDKSKQDSLIKALALGQTVCFVAQCIGRGIQGLPVSTLEITTMAYVACMLPSMLFWWSKPYGIVTPTPLDIAHWPPGSSEQLDKLASEDLWVLYRQMSLTRYPRVINSIALDSHWVTRDLSRSPNWVVLAFTAALFGGVHCIAWNFEFPTVVERWLWRASGGCIMFMAAISPICLRRFRIVSSWKDIIADRGIAVICLGVVYLVLRLYLMVEVFIAFRAMPAGVYDTPDWTLYVPNI